MTRSVEHADEKHEGWSLEAARLLREFAQATPEFMTEDLRVWAHENGFASPPDPRAWGAVVMRGAQDNLIARQGFALTKVRPAHASPRTVWRSLIHKAAA